MTPTSLLARASEAGVHIELTDAGNIKARGSSEAIARWRPLIVDNKAELVVEMALRKRLTQTPTLQNFPAAASSPGPSRVASSPPAAITLERREAARASVEILLARMGAENEARAGWWRKPSEGRAEGLLELRFVDGTSRVIDLRDGDRR